MRGSTRSAVESEARSKGENAARALLGDEGALGSSVGAFVLRIELVQVHDVLPVRVDVAWR
jgi:hypothetical protein